MSLTPAERTVDIPAEIRRVSIENIYGERTAYIEEQIRGVTVVERKTTSKDRTVKVE